MQLKIPQVIIEQIIAHPPQEGRPSPLPGLEMERTSRAATEWPPWSSRQLLPFSIGMPGRCCVFGSSSLPLRTCAWPG